MLLQIPRQKLEKHDTIAETIKYDLNDILRLVFRDRKCIGETMLLNGALTFFAMPYLSIGSTYLISTKLNLPALWTGSAQGDCNSYYISGCTGEGGV